MIFPLIDCKKKIFDFVFLFFLATSTLAQTNRPEYLSIASPTAASLGKVADIPVSYHTGIPTIDIPIYTISEGTLTLPISLSYHASGLKVMEKSSWIGAGWSLNAGGVITRSVRGNSDDDTGLSGTYYLQNQGYYSYLYGPNPPFQDYFHFANGNKDGEPDLFFFNFAGYSGKFYFRADRTPVVLPEQDIQIKPLYCEGGATGCNTSTEFLYGWIVTTPDGVQYYFGKTSAVTTDVDPYETSNTYSFTSGLTYSKAISSWYLYKIKSADQLHEINLSYDREDYGYYNVSMFPTEDESGGIDLAKILVSGVRLSSITFTNGTVTFTPNDVPREDLSSNIGSPPLFDNDNSTYPNGTNTMAKALKQIRITGTDFDKTFDFNTGYFVDNTHTLKGHYGTGNLNFENAYQIHTDKKRLKLISVQERSTDNTEKIPPHIFTYYDEASVPRSLSLAQDHWGYFNDATNNAHLIPPLSRDDGYSFTPGANRESSWPAMRAGTLQKIQYPTGGTTEFEYKNHDVWIQKKSIDVVGTPVTKSETMFRASTVHTFTISSPTIYKVSTSTPNNNTGFGYAYVNFKNSNGTVDPSKSHTFSIGNVPGNHIINLQAGTYDFYVQSSYNSSYHPAQAILTQMFLNIRWENVVVGGLRVEKITSTSTDNNSTVVRNYNYASSGMSQGVLFGRPSYISIIRNERNITSGVPSGTDINGEYVPANGYQDGCIPVNSGPTTYAYYVSPSSVHPMRTTQGNHIGYNQVVASQTGAGSTVYNYKAFSNPTGDVSVTVIDEKVCNSSTPNFPPAPEVVDLSKGELVNVAYYNESGQLMKETKYQTQYTPEPVGVTGLIVKSVSSFNLATEYETKTAKKTKFTELEWTYEPPTITNPLGVIKESFFDSPNHTLETRTVVSEASPSVSGSLEISQIIKGKVLSEARNTYVADVLIPSCNPSKTFDQTHLTNMDQLLANYTAAKNACATFHCKYMAWQTYIQNVNNERISYLTSRASYYQTRNDCMNLPATYSNASVELKALIDLINRNEIQKIVESSRWRDGNFLSSSYTTFQQFDANRLLTYPGRIDVMLFEKPSSSSVFQPVTSSNTAITKDTEYELLETYQYKTGFVSEVLGKDGITTAYLWDTAIKRPIVKAVGVTYTTLNAAYVAVSGNLSTLRNQASLSNAQVFTYTYSRLVGPTSITDPNGFSANYSYDKLGRLRLVKDHDNNILKQYHYQYKIQ